MRCARAFAVTLALLCFGSPLSTGHVQADTSVESYTSPRSRGVRPKYHRPILPGVVVSMHGLAGFPMGATDNIASPIQPGPGFRLSGAWQPTRQMAAEISYRASTHEATTGGAYNRGFFQSIHVGGVFYPMKNDHTFRPFISAAAHALGFFSERIVSHRLSGFGIDLASGVGVFLSRHTSVSIGLRYLGTFVTDADASFFGSRANSSSFINQLSPEIGLVFYP